VHGHVAAASSHTKTKDHAAEDKSAEIEDEAADESAAATSAPKHEKDFYPYILIGKQRSDKQSTFTVDFRLCTDATWRGCRGVSRCRHCILCCYGGYP